MHIHVANLPREIDEKNLRELFAPFGTLSSVKIDLDKVTGKPNGFAEVEMPEDEQGQKAIAGLHGKKLTEYALSLKDITSAKMEEKRHAGRGGRGKKGGQGGKGGAKGQGFHGGAGFQGGVARRGGQRGS